MRHMRLHSNLTMLAKLNSLFRRVGVVVILVFALVFALVFSNDVLSQENPDTHLLDIKNSQFSDSFETLLIGENEVAMIVSESNTPISRGVAVLISDYGANPMSEHGLANLAPYLNNLGWVTLNVQAPNQGFLPASSLPQNESEEQTNTSAKKGLDIIDEQAFEQQELMFMQQLNALQSKADSYSGFLIVIAQGTSAAWLTKMYAEKRANSPDAFVAISPHWPQRQFNQNLPNWVAQTDMPYLDIYTNADNDWAASTVSERKIQAEKSLKLMYRQRKLIGQTFDRIQPNFLAKEIYGWLTFMGW